MRRSNRNRGAVAGVGSLLPLVLVLAGCGGGSPQAVTRSIISFTPEQRADHALARDARYRLRAGDRFSVAFKYETDLNQSNIVIMPDGYFTIPDVEGVQAAGLTVSELDSALTERYGQDYRNPELTIIINELTQMPVYVLGEVNRPGLVEMPDAGGGVLQAVSLAGGFRDGSSPKETALIRVSDEGFELRRFDLGHLEKQGLSDLAALDVRSYDIIYVPRSAMGDLYEFNRSVLAPIVSATRIFWDVYAIANISKIDRIVR